MSLKKEEREQIKKDLINEIGSQEYSNDFNASIFAKKHGLSIQTVYRYLTQLDENGIIKKQADGKSNHYILVDESIHLTLNLDSTSEDKVWRDSVAPLLLDVPKTAFASCNYAFTEMLNNAIDHSGGRTADITVKNNPYRIKIIIKDKGVGIFTKIADALKLDEKRFAVLELAKGKFTTDPGSHSGEGIFFSSKAVDSFVIYSDGLMFFPLQHSYRDAEYMLSSCRLSGDPGGTIVIFSILHSHKQTMKELFDKYTQEPEHYGFTKTIVPVELLEYGDENALFTSRSQAKRLLARFEKFEYIDLDFTGIDEIGQGFADEVFRVFPSNHPGTKLNAKNCSKQVQNMINHVTHTAGLE